MTSEKVASLTVIKAKIKASSIDRLYVPTTFYIIVLLCNDIATIPPAVSWEFVSNISILTNAILFVNVFTFNQIQSRNEFHPGKPCNARVIFKEPRQ